ncbi:MAG: GNAT family N-acetyltransferase, partial [Bacteroidota bacterium]
QSPYLLIFQEGKMIAVLGIALPTEESPCLVITDIAVHPKLRGKGIGKAVIHHLLQLYPQASFKTFVDEKNINAISFFEHLEWKKMEVIDEDGMWVFFMRRRINHPKSM